MPQPRRNLRPGDYQRAEDLASEGNAQQTIAKELGVSWHRFRELRDGADPRLAAALHVGKARDHDAVAGKLRAKALAGNVVAMIFYLKARHGYIDQPKPESGENRVQITFQLPAPLAPADYAKLVSAVPRRELREAGLLEGGEGAGGNEADGDGGQS